MLELFEIDDLGNLTLAPEALFIIQIKALWERDNTERKEDALRDVAYMFFLVSPAKRNPFSGYDETSKLRFIKEHLNLSPTYEPDELVVNAINWFEDYIESSSYTYQFFKSAKSTCEKVAAYFETIEMDAKDDNGKPLHDPAKVLSAVEKTEKVITSMLSLEKKVRAEIFETNKTRKDRNIGHYER